MLRLSICENGARTIVKKGSEASGKAESLKLLSRLTHSAPFLSTHARWHCEFSQPQMNTACLVILSTPWPLRGNA